MSTSTGAWDGKVELSIGMLKVRLGGSGGASSGAVVVVAAVAAVVAAAPVEGLLATVGTSSMVDESFSSGP